MRRRDLITLLGGATAMWPLAAHGQRVEKIYHIGVLETTPVALNTPNFDALRNGLRDLGYVEGQTGHNYFHCSSSTSTSSSFSYSLNGIGDVHASS